MHDAECQADDRAPDDEGRGLAAGEQQQGQDNSTAQQVDRSDDQHRGQQQWQRPDRAGTRERIGGPGQEHRGNTQGDDVGPGPATFSSHGKGLARTEEAVPGSTLDDDADVQHGSHGAEGGTEAQEDVDLHVASRFSG